MGPETYDQYGVAVNQIVKHKGWYYAYYHATAFADWSEWSTNVSALKDLVHWKKYDKNPIMEQNRSSGILVPDGQLFRLYTMHDKVEVHMHKNTSAKQLVQLFKSTLIHSTQKIRSAKNPCVDLKHQQW